MRKIKFLIKKIIIYIVILMIILSSIVPAAFAYDIKDVGNAVAGFAKHVVDDCGDHVVYSQPSRRDNPIWNPSKYKSWDEQMYFDCTSFATGCYNYVTGLISQPYPTASLAGMPDDMKDYFTKSDKPWDGKKESLENGDLMYYHNGGTDGHGWIYSGNGETSEDGYFHNDVESFYGGRGDIYIYRINEKGAKAIKNLNTKFAIAGSKNGGSGVALGIKVDYSNFFFNGIPDGKYSLATRESIFEIIADLLSDLLNYFTGLLAYIFRGVLISFISIFDRLINNTVDSINDSPKSFQESGVSATNADDPYSMNRSVTLEGLIFNDIDLFDINIFKTN